MDLKEQEYVVALAEYGSITRAAEALFISQPTLSIFLSRLENRLGTPLFDKIGRKLVPTVAGELYVRRAKELLMIQSQFQGELSDLISGSYGRLRLGIHSRRSSYLLPKVMAQFRIHLFASSSDCSQLPKELNTVNNRDIENTVYHDHTGKQHYKPDAKGNEHIFGIKGQGLDKSTVFSDAWTVNVTIGSDCMNGIEKFICCHTFGVLYLCGSYK